MERARNAGGSLEQQVLDEYRSVEGRWPTRDVPGRFV
jgi:hypothetical protein